jgi:hypothetical protein
MPATPPNAPAPRKRTGPQRVVHVLGLIAVAVLAGILLAIGLFFAAFLRAGWPAPS